MRIQLKTTGSKPTPDPERRGSPTRDGPSAHTTRLESRPLDRIQLDRERQSRDAQTEITPLTATRAAARAIHGTERPDASAAATDATGPPHGAVRGTAAYGHTSTWPHDHGAAWLHLDDTAGYHNSRAHAARRVRDTLCRPAASAHRTRSTDERKRPLWCCHLRACLARVAGTLDERHARPLAACSRPRTPSPLARGLTGGSERRPPRGGSAAAAASAAGSRTTTRAGWCPCHRRCTRA